MQKDDEIRLRHMLDAAAQALDFARAETRDSLSKEGKDQETRNIFNLTPNAPSP
jgi:hypothetical protein